MKNLIKSAKCKTQCAILRGMVECREFMEGEKGASDMVAVIVLIVIVIGVAVLFRDTIMEVAQAAMDKLRAFVS